MTQKVIRTTIAKAIVKNKEILYQGQSIARYLWNELWWCAVGHNRKLARARGHKSLAGRLPKYLSKFGMDKEMRDFWAFRDLSDRCASYTLADFDIAMRSWFSNLKRNSDARPPRPMKRDALRPLRFEPGRNAKHLGNWEFKLTVLGGHITERHTYVKLQVQPGIKVSQVKLIQIMPDFRTVVMYEKQITEATGNGIASVDLGIVNLATLFFDDGESIMYTGRGLLESDQRYAKKIASCKPSGYPDHGSVAKPSKRQLAYHSKATNRRRRMMHNVTRDITRQCQQRQIGTIVVGDLKGIRQDKNWGKRMNQKLHRWSFGEFVRQLEYKGEEAGIKIVKVNERGTSSTCLVCDSKKVVRRPRGLLTCRDCGAVANSDLAGVVNILKKYRPDFTLGVEANLPGLRQTSTGGNPQITPTFVARFDLRGLQLKVNRCGARLHINNIIDIASAS